MLGLEEMLKNSGSILESNLVQLNKNENRKLPD